MKRTCKASRARLRASCTIERVTIHLAPNSRTCVVSHERAVLELEIKDPDATTNYMWSLGAWLDEQDTTLTYYAAEVDAPAEPTLSIASTEDDTPTPGEDDVPLDPLEGFTAAAGARNVVAWLAAGTLNVRYRVRLRFKTAAGHTEDRSFTVDLRQR